MSEPKYVLVAHMGHDAPWLQIKTRQEVKYRIAYIKAEKPERERPLRLKLLKIVKNPLPPKLAEAEAAWVKSHEAREKAHEARVNAHEARVNAHEARVNAHEAWVKSHEARVNAYAAWVNAYAAWVNADVAREKAYVAWEKADAVREKAYVAWAKAIISHEGVAFHKKVCECAWTPEQPDILLQLAAAQEEKE